MFVSCVVLGGFRVDLHRLVHATRDIGLNCVYIHGVVLIYWFCTIFSCKSQFALYFIGCKDILDLLMNGIYPVSSADGG